MTTRDWTATAEPVELTVACSGARHRLRWADGRLVPLDHPDLAAERALIALGGDEPPCLGLIGLWEEAVTDGGFLAEWVDEHGLGPARRSWLGTALERMASQGFHEFLHHLPTPRAGRMGRFLHRFPGPFLDRAAGAVSAASAEGRHPVCEQAPRHLEAATTARLRRAFVTAVGGRQLSVGSAALVPLSMAVGPGLAPEAAGRLAGAGRGVRLRAPSTWLHEVWAAGAAVVDGQLVLARRTGADGGVELAAVHWDRSDIDRSDIDRSDIDRSDIDRSAGAEDEARVRWRSAVHGDRWAFREPGPGSRAVGSAGPDAAPLGHC